MKPFRLPAAENVSLFSGILPAARPLVIADRVRQANTAVILVLCARAVETHELHAAVPQFARLGNQGDEPFAWAILPPPPPDQDPDDPMPERLLEELECDRLTALTHLSNFAESPPAGQKLVVFTTPDGLFAPAV